MTSDDTSKISAALKKRYENMPESVREYWNKKIDEELARRKKKGSIGDDPTEDRHYKGPNRQLGQQDIGDISYKEPWQNIVRNKLGVTLPINRNYRCPCCGYEYALDMPPDRCIMCGAKSFLHLRNLVNLRR